MDKTGCRSKHWRKEQSDGKVDLEKEMAREIITGKNRNATY